MRYQRADGYTACMMLVCLLLVMFFILPVLNDRFQAYC
ncbi:hypothetical protein ABIE60_002851 [Marinobacterium sp. MBR-109]